MSTKPLDEVLKLIDAEPNSAAALTLYALVSTLECESAGCLFKLTKLRDMDAAHRSLAYALMELMAVNGNQGGEWERAKARMDESVRCG